MFRITRKAQEFTHHCMKKKKKSRGQATMVQFHSKKHKSVSSVWLCPYGKFINTLNSNPHPTIDEAGTTKSQFLHAPPCLARVTHTSQKETDKACSCKRQRNKHVYFFLFLFSFFFLYLSDVNEAHHGSIYITSKNQKIGSFSPRPLTFPKIAAQTAGDRNSFTEVDKAS